MSASPVCVLGMHRSGTSMFAGLLHECGFQLGRSADIMPASPDNPVGYWENRRFVEINDSILKVLGGTWNEPPLPSSDWTTRADLDPLRSQAQALADSFKLDLNWAWKDPRTCLTLPFWKEILPGSKYIVCIRHPLEVGQSFAARKFSQMQREKSLELWKQYYTAMMPNLEPGSFMVTHYVSYFYDAERELQRVFRFLGGDPPLDMAEAARTVRTDLWHGFGLDHKNEYFEVPDDVQAIYDDLCSRAGEVFHDQQADMEFQETLRGRALEKAIGRIATLEQLYTERSRENEELSKYVSDLRGNVSLASRVTAGIKRRIRLRRNG